MEVMETTEMVMEMMETRIVMMTIISRYQSRSPSCDGLVYEEALCLEHPRFV